MNDSAFAKITLLFCKSADSEYALEINARTQKEIGNVLMFFISPFSVQTSQTRDGLLMGKMSDSEAFPR